MNELVIANVFDSYAEMKRIVVADPNQDNDMPMILYAGPEPLEEPGGDVVCVMIPTGQAHDVAGTLARIMAEDFIPNWCILCADVWTAKDDDIDFRGFPNHGLGLLFLLGHPAVSEALTVTAVSHDGSVYVDNRRYWYDDDGDIWFHDSDGVLRDAEKTQGLIFGMLQDATSLWGLPRQEVLNRIADTPANRN